MNILFVVMPFGAIRPAIGVSLLKACLVRKGICSEILYLNIRFARRVGFSDFDYVADRSPTQSLAGDWVFAECLCGRRPEADEAYLKTFERRFRIFGPTEQPIETITRCRSLADEFLKECLSEVDWRRFDMVGFTSTFSQHAASLALAKAVKDRFPDLPIVFGGANCEDVMGLQLHRSFPFVDFVCSGEADLSFPQLAQALQEGKDVREIPGVISRSEGQTSFSSLTPERERNLDALPTPDYGEYFQQLQTLSFRPKTGGVALIESSRGCWWGEKHHCTFCGLNGTSMTFRSKSAKRVLEELSELQNNYHPDYIAAVDNILDMKYFRDLVPALATEGLHLGIFYETKANLTKEHLRLLRAAGIATIQPGIESLSTSILRLMRKGTTAIQNVQMLKWCSELGIVPFWNLIYGFPGEDQEEYDKISELIEALYHLRPPHGIGPIRLDRFSPNFVRANDMGIINVRPDSSYNYIFNLPEEQLNKFAYYFEHGYQDGRDPERYISKARRAVARWQEYSDNPGLKYADHGRSLAIWDRRPRVKRTVTILTEVERAVYLYCDQHRTLHQIERMAQTVLSGTSSVQQFLDDMVRDRLMIHLDGSYLSLATLAASAEKAKTTSAERNSFVVA
jgi:ribosomal peptide maturation radical SAM protein 1